MRNDHRQGAQGVDAVQRHPPGEIRVTGQLYKAHQPQRAEEWPMHTITDWLGSLSGPVVYAVVGALVYAEDALFFGFVLPGETAVVLGGVLASQGRISVDWLLLIVVCAAIAGDSTGFEIGHRLGPAIQGARPLRRHIDRVRRAQELIRRRGPMAVFLGRFVAFFRAMMPALAGVSHMPYRRFLLYNALGGVTWGVGFTLLGYFAGTAYARVEGLMGRATAIVIAAVMVAAPVVWHFRRRHKETAGDTGILARPNTGAHCAGAGSLKADSSKAAGAPAASPEADPMGTERTDRRKGDGS